MVMPQSIVTIKVTRAFYYNGQPQEKGTVLNVSAGFAAEMISFNKAEKFEGPPPTTNIIQEKPKTIKKEEK